jgi:PKHD-type hydroxylase
MNFQQQTNDPQNFYWYKQGFTKEELDQIYNNVAQLPFENATILGENNIEAIKAIRSSSIKWIPKNQNWQWLYDKLMNMATEANKALWDFDLISVDEKIQYTEYYDTAEGHYTWHQDIGTGNASKRKVSITVQLSDPEEYEGGDLEMWQGGESVIKAEKGAGVVFIFPSYMMHRVTKVTKGTRRSFVLWVGGQHYR